MSEPTATESAQDGNQSGQTSTAQDFKPITTPAELDAFLKDRVARAERKATEKFADYDELKAKASQLDALSEASQTETEKAAKRAAKAEADRDDARAEALRLRVAVEHGISIEDADLFLTGKDDATLRAQAQRLADREADRKKNGNVVPREGTSTRPAESDEAAFARSLFAGD
jgi:hypothetical protein